MSRKSRPTDKDNLSFSKNKHIYKTPNKSMKKTINNHGYTEKSRKMVILIFFLA